MVQKLQTKGVLSTCCQHHEAYLRATKHQAIGCKHSQKGDALTVGWTSNTIHIGFKFIGIKVKLIWAMQKAKFCYKTKKTKTDIIMLSKQQQKD